MPTLPYVNSNKDHESPLGLYRVAKGMTINELAMKVGTTPATISALQNGTITPHYLSSNSKRKRKWKKGEIKPYVKKICKVLEVELEDLFPRYICEIERLNLPELLTTDPQLSYQVFQDSDLNQIEMKITANQLFEAISKELDRGEIGIIIERFLNGKTRKETAEMLTISPSRIGQLEGYLFRRIKSYLSRNDPIYKETEEKWEKEFDKLRKKEKYYFEEFILLCERRDADLAAIFLR